VKILVVDDSPDAGRTYGEALAGGPDETQLAVVSDEGRALERLGREPFDVLIVDVGGSATNGARLLEAALRLDPRMVRIIVSDGSDEQRVLGSVKAAHQCLTRPFDAGEFRAVLARAGSIHDLLADRHLADLVAGIDTLPSLPAQYLRLMDEIQSETSSLERVGQIVSEDIGMAATVLKLVNSSFFGLRREVTGLVQAVTLLGLDIIGALAISHHLFSTFDQRRVPAFSFDGLWRHSLVTGGFARKIALQARQDKSAVDRAFIAGLLHDAGKLVLGSTVTDRYNEVLRIVNDENRLVSQVEREVLGTSHAEVGAYLTGLWGLDDTVVEALAYHHRPSACPRQEFSPLAAVHVANILEHELCVIHQDYARPELDAVFLARTSLQDKVDRWRDLYRRVVESREAN